MKVGIIGAGSVGAATAFALIMKGVARKVVLIDSNQKKAEAEAEDIAHAAPFAYANKIKAGNYEDLKGCEIVIVTAGANQKPGETRIDLLGRNVKIFESIIPQIAKAEPNTTLIITANPADIMTEVAIKLSGFPKERVIGSGTVSLDKLAEEVGKPFDAETKAKIDDGVRNAAYKIIDGKGATYYGIAGALTRICAAITNNEYAILTVSSHQEDVEGVKGVCVSLPTVLGKRGVHKVIYPVLNAEEKAALKKSAEAMKEYSDKALAMVAAQ